MAKSLVECRVAEYYQGQCNILHRRWFLWFLVIAEFGHDVPGCLKERYVEGEEPRYLLASVIMLRRVAMHLSCIQHVVPNITSVKDNGANHTKAKVNTSGQINAKTHSTDLQFLHIHISHLHPHLSVER